MRLPEERGGFEIRARAREILESEVLGGATVPQPKAIAVNQWGGVDLRFEAASVRLVLDDTDLVLYLFVGHHGAAEHAIVDWEIKFRGAPADVVAGTLVRAMESARQVQGVRS